MTTDRIGRTAGVVWDYLEKHTEATPEKIKRETKVPADLLHEAIGWLAREDKLRFSTQGKYVKISLKKI